ncbi:hypothetical protein QEN19_001360 [Hanseniaspora menglaensis]
MSFQGIVNTCLSNTDFNNSFSKLALGLIVLNPTTWNVIARLDHKYRVFSKKIFNSKYKACYSLAILIFTLGIFRDHAFLKGCVLEQPSVFEYLSKDSLWIPLLKVAGGLFFAAGQILNLGSMYKLGIDGTYLGDYFGILKDEKLSGFPFNVVEHPMYIGSSLSFLGTAIYYGSPFGVAVSGFVRLVYQIAEQFEGPFTNKIYAKREEEREAAKAQKISNGAFKEAKTSNKLY